MNKVLQIASFVYMMVIAAFLAFAAMFVCDGYYPVGWGWKGGAIHVAMWAMPVSLVAGSFMSALGIRMRVARTLLVAGIAPSVATVAFFAASAVFSTNHPPERTWLRLPLTVAGNALLATWILFRKDSRNALEHKRSGVREPA